MDFRQWLEQHLDADTAVGDLARDVEAAECWAQVDSRWALPQRNTLGAWRTCLQHCGACGEALDTLDEAWRQYRAERARRDADPTPADRRWTGRRTQAEAAEFLRWIQQIGGDDGD